MCHHIYKYLFKCKQFIVSSQDFIRTLSDDEAREIGCMISEDN